MMARASRNLMLVMEAAFVLLIGAVAQAQGNIAVRAGISQEKIVAGETLFYTIEIDSDTEQPVRPPESPDFGGLQVLGAPRTSQRISIVNGVQQVSFSYSFPLTSTQAGTYAIPPITITAGGQTFQTESYTVQVMADSLDSFPSSLQKEAILNPRSGDAGINQQLRGRMCLVPKVSDIQPFVGEPFAVSFVLYVDSTIRPAIQDYDFIVPKNQELLSEEVPQQQTQKSFHVENVEGREFNVVEYYDAVFTPTKPGEVTIDGYGVRIQLVVRSSSFFSNTLPVDVMTGPIKVTVRAIPEDGRPAGFGGTIGEYTLQGGVDRNEASMDDIITLSVKLVGKGNIAQATLPTPPAMDDFELFDQTQEVQKSVTKAGISGVKSAEFLLRPRRAEKLTLPPFEYVIFDPSTETYQTLTVPAATVSVTQGKSLGAVPTPVEGSEAQGDEQSGLRYIKPMIDVSLRPHAPLTESMGYWGTQIGAIALAGWAYSRARRRGRMDPVLIRRMRAPEELHRKISACTAEISSGKIEDATLSLERAVREYVADLQNCSSEGLTADEIVERLRREKIDAEAADKVRAALVFCSSVRYAPGVSATSDLRRMVDETSGILSAVRTQA